jgi:quercetin dioxygenase-like cupin family protein
MISRRELAVLLPALAAAQETKQPAAAKPEAKQPSACFPYEQMPVKASGQNKQRAVFSGATHSGYHVDMHLTELAPGLAPHAAHRHVHEEMVMVQRGTLEVTIEGKSTKLGPGSVGYVASNEMHGWKNIGDGPCEYFVLALGRDA